MTTATESSAYYKELKARMQSFLKGSEEIVDPETKYASFIQSVLSNFNTVRSKAQGILSGSKKFVDIRREIGSLSIYQCEYMDIASQNEVGEQEDSLSVLHQLIPDITLSSISPENRKITFEAPFPMKYGAISFVHKTKITVSFGDVISIRAVKHPLHKSDTRAYVLDPKLNPKSIVSSLIGAIYTRLHELSADLILDPIESYIGVRCPVCQFHTFTDKTVTCHETKVAMHQDCAVQVGSAFYSPTVARECSKCKRVSLKWVPNADNRRLVTCGSCINE